MNKELSKCCDKCEFDVHPIVGPRCFADFKDCLCHKPFQPADEVTYVTSQKAELCAYPKDCKCKKCNPTTKESREEKCEKCPCNLYSEKNLFCRCPCHQSSESLMETIKKGWDEQAENLHKSQVKEEWEGKLRSIWQTFRENEGKYEHVKNLIRELLSHSRQQAYADGYADGAKIHQDTYEIARQQAVKEALQQLEEELMNGGLRDSFERYFEKDNIDADGNYLNRKSTTNRSGALAYLGDINAFIRTKIKTSK